MAGSTSIYKQLVTPMFTILNTSFTGVQSQNSSSMKMNKLTNNIVLLDISIYFCFLNKNQMSGRHCYELFKTHKFPQANLERKLFSSSLMTTNILVHHSTLYTR